MILRWRSRTACGRTTAFQRCTCSERNTGPGDSPSAPLRQPALTALARHQVRYVVVGGIAAILHGWPGATADLDLLGENFVCLAAALRELGAQAEGWDGAPETIATVTAWSFETDAGPIDLLFVLEPWGTYDELRATAAAVPGFGITIPVVSLDNLIELKRALGRPKDLRVAVELEDLRRQRES